jgi:hypothetical protein
LMLNSAQHARSAASRLDDVKARNPNAFIYAYYESSSLCSHTYKVTANAVVAGIPYNFKLTRCLCPGPASLPVQARRPPASGPRWV